MADDLDTYLNALSDRIHDQLSGVIQEQAEALSAAQKAALRSLEDTDETHDLEDSCTVVAGENDLEFIVQAGGAATTKEIRDGSGVPYDYAEAFEFGTSRQEARPFFWPTYRAMKPGIEKNLQDALNEALND
jgi:HK97 gp10 family phage protein